MTLSVAIALAIAAAGLCGVGVFIVTMIRHGRRQQAAQERALELLHTSLARLGARAEHPQPVHGARWRITRGDRRLTAHRPNRKGAPFVELAVELEARATAGPGPFRRGAAPGLDRLPRVTLRRERPLDRFGKALRLNRELQLGDARFDGAVYIESDAHDDELLQLLAAPHLREAVVDLVAQGGEVVFNEGEWSLAVAWPVMPPEDGLERALESLCAVADALPTIGSLEPASAWSRGSGFVAASAVGLLVGWVLWAIGDNFFQALGHDATAAGMWIGAASYAALIVATFARVRGSSRALRLFGWTVVLGLAACPLLAVGGLWTANGLFDGNVQVREVEVQRRWARHGKSSRYYVLIAPWPPHREPLEVHVGSDEYGVLPEKGLARMRIGSGALGFEWFAGVAPRN